MNYVADTHAIVRFLYKHLALGHVAKAAFDACTAGTVPDLYSRCRDFRNDYGC